MSARQEKAQGWLDLGPGFGSSSTGSSEKSAPSGSSSRTSPAANAVGCRKCGRDCASLVTKPWPWRSEPETLVLRTEDSGFSLSADLWTTPTVTGNHNKRGASANSGDGLATQVKVWPTPNATDYKGASTRTAGKERPPCDDDLPTALARLNWPTPLATSYGSNRGGAAGRTGPDRPSLATLVRWATPRAIDGGPKGNGPRPDTLTGQVNYDAERKRVTTLSPDWVTQIMGFPDGWLDVGQPGEVKRSTRGKRLGVRPPSRKGKKSSGP